METFGFSSFPGHQVTGNAKIDEFTTSSALPNRLLTRRRGRAGSSRQSLFCIPGPPFYRANVPKQAHIAHLLARLGDRFIRPTRLADCGPPSDHPCNSQ